MKPISISDLEEFSNSKEPEVSIHLCVHDRYNEFGYDMTQNWIKQTLENWKWDKYLETKEYLIKRVNENKQFEPFKEELLSLTLELDYDKLELWVYDMKKKGLSKKRIFDILSELFVFIQYNPKTANDESNYDFVADFLDRFTSWGMGFRILPNEPDC